ncbi:bifunctional P-450:NADPH-P450 reductase [Xylariaceae sp. FL0255]|nr:bifunctional P-450:NADPH-P450 reductase [Xylariaceae sp. FL0255]
MTTEHTVPIPSPPGLPFIGNAIQIDPIFPLGSFKSLAEKYGEVYRLNFPGRTTIFVSSVRLIDECCDESRFIKIPNGALAEVRNGVNDGLFTAKPGEENWGIAHRILMPAVKNVSLTLHRFGPVSIRGMFDEMHDIASQLALKFARHGPTNPIPASEDFTRLALDTLALCSMGYRFNSFYTKELHPFVESMGDFLIECGNRPSRVLPSWFYKADDAKYYDDITVLRKTAEEVLKARKENPNEDRKDLLHAMLKGVDSKTGKKMSDASIIDNLITFLIAGHETTSGTLSFAFYRLLKNPDVYQKVQEEVDRVVGKGPITVEHLSKVPYVTATIKEALRLDSPISLFVVTSKEDTLLANKYPVNKNEPIALMVCGGHVDPTVWGEDVLEFKPERMLDENFNKLPKNAWKPFGNGARACIGRPFAMQEAILTMIMLFQNFNFVMHDPSYRLVLKQTLTIKPDKFHMRAIPRDNMTPTQLEHRLAGHISSNDSQRSTADEPVAANTGKKITILYGSNSGTCDSLAQRLAGDAPRHGFVVDKIDCLDAAQGSLPKGQPVVIITASYEGEPPENASLFCSWVANTKGQDAFSGVDYTVFGVGHHDWAQTYHRVPKLVDTKLADGGATRLTEIGLSDVGSADAFADFETWEDSVLWPALEKKYGATDAKSALAQSMGLSVEVTNPRTSTLRTDVMEGLVVATKTLTAEGEPVKKHIEITLPSGQHYQSGDYLAVLPVNPKVVVDRVMRRFHLAWDSHITIAEDASTALPTNVSMPAQNLLSAYVELSQPATKRNILALAETTEDQTIQDSLRKYANEDYAEVANNRISVLDLLEKFPSINLPLGMFLAMLPPMRVRQYSISSSPLWNPSHVTLTFGVLEAPSKSGTGVHVGVASSYLNSLAPGDKLHVAVRPSHAAFHLPQDPENTPVICIGAGTGLSPFRGFIQERAEMIKAGRKLAPAILLFGCRQPGRDDIYAEELAEWEKLGAVSVKRAYSRAPEKSGGSKYVQELLSQHHDEVIQLWEGNAKLFICGSRAIGQGVKDEIIKMGVQYRSKVDGEEVSEESIQAWWEGLRNVRYATDVFD